MSAILCEKLAAGQALYKIPYTKKIYPGQWISAGNNQYSVFRYSNNELYFIAPRNSSFADEFHRCGEPLFLPDEDKPLILLSDNQAIPLMFFLIHHLLNSWGHKKLRSRVSLILMGVKTDFLFTPVPSVFLLSGFPASTIASAPLLEDWELPARLASCAELPGCYPGSLVSLLMNLDFSDFNKQNSVVVAIGSSRLLQVTKQRFSGDSVKHYLVKFDG